MDYRELENAIAKKQLAPIYLLYGEEAYLREEILKKLKHAVLDPQTEDFNFDRVDGESISLEGVISLANTLPFLGDKRLVWVREAPYFRARRKNKEEEGPEEEKEYPGEQAFFRYLAVPNPDCCLVFTTEQPVDKRRRIFKDLNKVGHAVEIAPLKGRSLQEWTREQSRSLGKKLEPGVLDFLLARLGNNLGLIVGELEKLALYGAEEKTVTLAMAKEILSRTTEGSIFDLMDGVGEKQVEKAITLLREMLQLGEAPLKILFMLSRQVRLILLAKHWQEKGLGESQIAASLQAHPFVVQKALKQGRNFTFSELEKTLEEFLRVDEAIKTGKGEPEFLLEMAIIKMCTS